MQRTSQTKIYNVLGLEPIRLRQWFIHLCALYKINTTCLPPYLNVLPEAIHHYQTQNSVVLATYQTRINIFKYSFDSYSIMDGIYLALTP